MLKKISQPTIYLPFLGGVFFLLVMFVKHEADFLKTGTVIAIWGTIAFTTSRYSNDPSWNFIFHFSFLSYVIAYFLILKGFKWVASLDALAITYCLTYIAAKYRCYRCHCCRGLRTWKFLNPKTFKTFDWLQIFEILVSVITLLVVFLIILLRETPGIAFFVFLLLHSLLRTLAYYLRSTKFKYLDFLLHYHTLYLIAVLVFWLKQ